MGILAVLYFAIPNLNYYDLKFREAFPGLYDCTTICIQTLGSALIALIAFVIVNRTIKNKLNLE